jgi:acyl transferase domain-containing protein/NAD(P)H-dependent flavin oxidoreductase YrpB (nitropropane dioxygenase family)
MSKTDMKNTSSLNRGKTTIGQNFQIFALTPPGLPDPAIAIAASRAGGIGILDLEYISDVNVALESIRKMVRYSRNNCGIKLNGLSDSFITHLIPELPEDIGVVIFTKCEPEKLHNYVKDVRCQKRLVMLEINSLEQAMIGEQADVDGLIAKGNEAAGLVGEKTAFILLQQLRSRITKPLWIQGGVGLHTATACYTAGAAGIVLDSQLALTRESPLPENVKKRISVMDGTETVCVGNNVSPCRIYGRPGHPLVNELFAIEESSENDSKKRQRTFYQWHEAIRERISWEEGNNKLWLLGQDVAFAAPLATRYDTVGQIMQAFRRAIDENIQTAKSFNILEKESPLARSHETEYPIVQGPMARVSDNAAFMADVSEAGGLPFLALSKLSGDKSKKLLEEVDDLLGTKPWGIGILGFNEPALFQSQMEAINSYPPRFAIIAGGMPNQVAMLESKGIQTYVHMQSASVMEMFIDEGARRFIFEGRECGGHIGPRSCFVLWEDMMGKLLEILENTSHEPEKFHVLFAGGIHDALSAAMVASLAAPIVKAGVRVGVVMGTAYLFTEEIVKTGAIVKGFQKHALQCSETTVLETGPGHAIRCCKTPYVNFFENEKKKLQHKGLPQDQIRSALEALVVGRLRIASKGIARNRGAASQKDKTNAREISEKDQHAEGIYMVGQLTAMRNKTQSIKDLHKDVSEKSSLILSERCEIEDIPRQLPSDIAIIGMACVFPKAGDLQTYWENILYKVNAITEAPTSRWDWQLYFDKNRKTKDKIYSRWGGFLDEIPFDPMKYGIPPASLDSIEPLHLMTLEVVSAALKDAGYERKEFPREKTSVIIGTGAGIGDLGQKYIMRSTLPLIFDMHSDDVMRRLPEWTEDSFPGILMNVTAGRVANRFDLGGVNYTVDAACASSLSALYDAVRELETGSSDMAIAGGIDAGQSPFTYLCFSKTQALSPSGKCRVFDEKANGTVISEGLALLVLKRLSDAERDGDRIYAVIKSVAGSSDGRDKSLTAPRPDGQLRALKKAYDKAGFSPETVELIEAHGTGTVVGDRTEAESVSRLLEENHAPKHGCAIGSVKSMIGHTKGAAGLAGVIKVALSLYHNVLPPTMGVDRPNEHIDFMKGPLYVNTELRPWIGSTSHGRRAGVNAFGFGGTNFHAILEEYGDEYRKKDKPSIVSKWPAELFLCSAYSRDELVSLIDNVELALKGNAALKIRELAYALYADYKEKTIKGDSPLPRLAFVASSVEEATEKLTFIRQSLNDPSCEHLEDPRGIYFSQSHRIETGKIAFLFPGQGSQYPNMLRDLSILFPEMRSSFEQADSVLSERLPERLSSYVFPPPHFSKEEEKQQRKELARTNIAQPALGAACQGVFNLLRNLNLHPDMVAGHSYGEYAALCASGVVNEMTLYEISEARGRLIIEAAQGRDLGTMAAVEMEASELSSLLKGIEGVVIANINSPKQTVISGEKSGILKALAHLESMDINARQIPVSAAFHSPKVEPAKKLFSEYLKKIPFSSPEIEVFSNTYAASYNRNTQKIKKCLSEHMVRPVKFVNEIEEMYKQGARIFIEVGPGSVLTNLTKQILGERAIAVSTDNKGREGLTHLLKTLGKLAMHGVPLSLERLYEGRSLRKLDLNSLSSDIEEKHSQTTWLVNGSHIIHPNRKKKQRNGNVALEAYKLRDRRLSGEQKKDEDLKNTELSSESDERSEAQMKRYSDVTFSTPQEGKRDKTSLPGASEFKKVPSTESHVSPDNMDAVMVQYQKLMNNFLETQKSIMLSYLQGNAQSIDQDFASESSLSQIRTEKVPVEKDSLHHAQADKPVEQAHPSQVDSAEEGIDTCTG